MPEGFGQLLRCAHINSSNRNSVTAFPRTLEMVTDAVSPILSFSGQGELVGEA